MDHKINEISFFINEDANDSYLDSLRILSTKIYYSDHSRRQLTPTKFREFLARTADLE